MRNPGLLLWLAVGVISASACGADSVKPVAVSTPIHRVSALTMSGALAGPFEVTEQVGDPSVCAGGMFNDPHGANYVLHGLIRGVTERDAYLIGLNFAVHRYKKPGVFTVGGFPDGAPAAPAVAAVTREITPKNIVTWITGTGSILVDAGARGGTLDLHLHSVSGLADLMVAGTWSCATA